MLKIEKKVSGHGYYFIISTDEGEFQISFGGNLDLYWSNLYDGNSLEKQNFKKFTITKENYQLYSLFNKLYEDIRNYNIYKLYEIEIDFLETKEELRNKKIQLKELNKNIEKIEKNKQNKLFKNNTIEWHSDDFEYSEASVLNLTKENEDILVVFEKSKDLGIYSNYSVRISNRGSRHSPFNVVFMEMYNSLMNYDFNDKQVNIEEYLYSKKLKNK